MAINTQKLLPSKTSPIVNSSSVGISQSKISQYSFNTGKKSNNIVEINDKLTVIHNLLKGSVAFDKKVMDDERKESQDSRRKKREKELEKKDEKENNKENKKINLPRIGFLDRVKNFIGNILIGYLAVRMIDHLPKLVGAFNLVLSVGDFITDFGIAFIDRMGSFLDAGYKAYDATKGFLKFLGGDNAVDAFVGFTNAVGKLVDVAIIAAIAMSTMNDDGGRGDVPRDRIRGRGKGRSIKGGASSQAARRYAQRFGRDAAVKRFGSDAVKSLGGKYGRSAATNLARRGAASLLGKQGLRVAVRTLKPFVSRVPLIGGIMEFVLSWIAGDPVGKAAFRGVGAGLGTWIGGALGTLIPVPGVGTAIGMFLGGMGGAELGGVIYDAIFKGKDVSGNNDVQGRQEGGPITRGNKVQSGPRRTITQKVQRKKPRRPSKVKLPDVPGKDIVNKEEYYKIFPKPVIGDNKPTATTAVRESGKELSEVDYFGPILTITSKITLGEKPSSQDYENAALGISRLLSKGFDEGELRGGLMTAFANGGLVSGGALPSGSRGMGITKWIKNEFRTALNTRLTSSLKKLRGVTGGNVPSDVSPFAMGAGSAGGWYGGYRPQEGIQKEIYEYLTNEKGLSDNQALGLMANISRESNFVVNVPSGDDGGAGGLFQWKKPRSDRMSAAVPDWQTNWKAQIDYALIEPGEPGPLYVSTSFSSPQQAADWWMEKWERPADLQAGSKKHQRYLASVPKGPDGSAKFRARITTGGSGSFNVTQYLTGDTTYRAGPGVNPNQFYYDPDHGGNNYHEHFGFNTVEDKNRAMRHLRNQGWEIGSTYRSGDPGLHGSNLAFDVPFYKPSDGGTQKGFSNDTAGEQAFSAAVRASMGMFHGGSTGKGGLIYTHEGEYIIDKDTVSLLGTDFFDIVNRIENESQLKQKAGLLVSRLSQFTTYDSRSAKKVVVPIPNNQPSMIPVGGDNSGVMTPMSPMSEEHDAYKQLYIGA